MLVHAHTGDGGRAVNRYKEALLSLSLSLGSCLNLLVPRVWTLALWAGFNLQTDTRTHTHTHEHVVVGDIRDDKQTETMAIHDES